MITMLNFSNPYKCIFIENGETKVSRINGTINNYMGIADEWNGDILGLFVYEDKLFFVKNNDCYDITNKKIECENTVEQDKRKFSLKVDNVILYESEYDFSCSTDDILTGTIEEEQDFMLYLSKILYSEETIGTFVEGFNQGQCKTL